MIEIDRPELTHRSLDDLVRKRLRAWPQRPPGALDTPKQRGVWMRARPGEPDASLQPYLRLPGSQRLRTMPDGLWLREEI